MKKNRAARLEKVLVDEAHDVHVVLRPHRGRYDGVVVIDHLLQGAHRQRRAAQIVHLLPLLLVLLLARLRSVLCDREKGRGRRNAYEREVTSKVRAKPAGLSTREVGLGLPPAQVTSTRKAGMGVGGFGSIIYLLLITHRMSEARREKSPVIESAVRSAYRGPTAIGPPHRTKQNSSSSARDDAGQITSSECLLRAP